MSSRQSVGIWDPFLRVFHWGLVAAFTTAYLSAEEVMNVHVVAGYTVFGLVVFRLAWGFLGPEHARFSTFVRGPRPVVAYLRGVLALRPPRYMGHNPAGGLMVVLLLASLLATTLAGLMLYGAEEHAGPLAGFAAGIGHDGEEAVEGVHEFFANFTLALVVVHVLGVVVESLLHRENLVGAMVTGRKRAAGS